MHDWEMLQVLAESNPWMPCSLPDGVRRCGKRGISKCADRDAKVLREPIGFPVHFALDPTVADDPDRTPQHLVMRGSPPNCRLPTHEPARNAVAASNRRCVTSAVGGCSFTTPVGASVNTAHARWGRLRSVMWTR